MITVIIALLMTSTAVAGDGRTESIQAKESAVAEKRNHVLPPLHTEKYEYYEVCGSGLLCTVHRSSGIVFCLEYADVSRGVTRRRVTLPCILFVTLL